jgi:hypothetical protein
MNNGKQPITPSMWTKCGEGIDDYQPLKDGQKTGWETKFGGLTKREYFAAKAMQGLLSNPEWMKEYKGEKYLMQDSIVSEIACKQADALIEALNK